MLDVFGKTYELRLGLDAVDDICKRLGCRLENLEKALTAASDIGQLELICFIAAAMMRSAYRREKVRCSLYGEESTMQEPLTAEQLMAYYDIRSAADLTQAVFSAFQADKGEIELKPVRDKKKEKSS